MTPAGIHLLTVTLAAPMGMKLALDCPHTPAGRTDAERAACRDWNGRGCLAVAQLAAFGLARVWHGRDMQIRRAASPVLVEFVDGRLRLSAAAGPDGAAGEGPLTRELAAQRLAELSGSPRYLGDAWRMLLEPGTANLVHAHGAAAKRHPGSELPGRYRDVLLAPG